MDIFSEGTSANLQKQELSTMRRKISINTKLKSLKAYTNWTIKLRTYLDTNDWSLRLHAGIGRLKMLMIAKALSWLLFSLVLFSHDQLLRSNFDSVNQNKAGTETPVEARTIKLFLLCPASPSLARFIPYFDPLGQNCFAPVNHTKSLNAEINSSL